MIGDWQVFGSPLLDFIERVETRVPGGYMDRWLIRKVEYRPNRNRIVICEAARQIFCHPALVDHIKRMLPSSDRTAANK